MEKTSERKNESYDGSLPLAPAPKKDGKYCIDCPDFASEGVNGVCTKFNWAIALELAKRDAVCME